MKDILGVKLERVDDKVVVYNPIDTSKKTQPIEVKNIEGLASQLYQSAVNKKWIDPTKTPQDKFTEEFQNWWTGKDTQPSTLNLDLLDEPSIPQVAPVTPPQPNPGPQPLQAPPIPQQVIPKPAPTLAEYSQPQQKITPKEPVKPKDISADWLKARYKELISETQNREKSIAALASESSIPASVLEGLIPPEATAIPKPYMTPFTPVPQAVIPPQLFTPGNPQSQPVMVPTPTQLPHPQPIATPTPVTTETVDLSSLTKGLHPTQLNWLREIAVKRKLDEKMLIVDYYNEAKKRPLPTHWTNIMFEDAMAHEIIKGKKDKYKYALLWTPQGQFVEAFVKPDVPLELGKCYTFPELGSLGRLISTSRAVGLDNFPDQTKPILTKVEDAGEMSNIPQPWQAYEPVLLRTVLDNLKYGGKPIIEAVSGTIIDVVPWDSGEGCFFSIHDGSDLPGLYSSKVMLNWENPAIDPRNRPLNEERLVAMKGKYCLVNGILSYQAGNPEKNFPEGLRIAPLYLIISG